MSFLRKAVAAAINIVLAVACVFTAAVAALGISLVFTEEIANSAPVSFLIVSPIFAMFLSSVITGVTLLERLGATRVYHWLVDSTYDPMEPWLTPFTIVLFCCGVLLPPALALFSLWSLVFLPIPYWMSLMGIVGWSWFTYKLGGLAWRNHAHHRSKMAHWRSKIKSNT